jgi:peptidoglycan hydrolase-like protein with peptidoglycan-binding domain
VRSISLKAALWTSGTVIAVGTGTAAVVLAILGGPGAHAPAAVKPRPIPLVMVYLAPTAGATLVNGAASVTVIYNRPLPADVPLPRLSPAVAGSWHRAGDTAVFTPAVGYPPRTRVSVMVALGSSDTRSTASSSFITGPYSTLGLQVELARLGYLPLTWTPATAAAVTAGTARGALSEAYAPPAGTFRWKRGYPAELRSFWSAGAANTMDQGAVTAFEADHGLPTDGVAGATVWKALLAATVKGRSNTHGYSYAIASQSIPETLTIWHDGRQVFSSYANTGISIRPTPIGTFPVYEKLPYQVMQGTNPDGSSYADPVWWVSYFNGGSAVHFISRGSYGSPQSLGCVELPYTAARDAYPYLPYGTLVTVTP